MSAQDTALATLAQLGGARFVTMTGARNLLSDSDGALSMRLPSGCREGINYVRIALDPSDTYSVTYGKIRGTDYRVIRESEGIYADQLRSDFESATGLLVSLGTMAGGAA